jgi:3-oxoacyl-[acyl-carrier-protein] synthase-3
MTRYAHITGWGMAIPERVLPNAELENIVETSDEWIRSRTGICERHIAADGQSTATLAIEATLEALDVANLKPAEVELIIVATSSPEHIFPATACIVQDAIGAGKAGAFDLSAACTGFIFALNMAAQAIRTGSLNNAVVIGSETLSRIVNWQDRNTCILFGDGAGAFVLQGSDQPGGFQTAVMRSDGSGGDLLSLPAGGSKYPTSMETISKGLHYIQMDGKAVFRFATRVMADAVRDTLQKGALTLEDIQLVVPHQANLRIIQSAARNLRLPEEKLIINLERYGNTSTASIPIATCEAVASGRLRQGDHVVFVGFGAGLTWGAALVTWTGPFPDQPVVRPRRYRWLARLRSLLRRIWRYLEGILWGESI